MAKNCMEKKDICSTCGGEHCHSNCNSYRTYYCVNCRSTSHSSTDKECPEYKAQLDALNACIPENSMPYFPTDELWTQVTLPPKPPGPIILPHPHPAETHRPDTANNQQRTLDWMLEKQTGKPNKHPEAPVINGRTLVPLVRSKQNQTPTHSRPTPPSSTPPSSTLPLMPVNGDNDPEMLQVPKAPPRTHLDPFPSLSLLHFPGNLPTTPQPHNHAHHIEPLQQTIPIPQSPSLLL